MLANFLKGNSCQPQKIETYPRFGGRGRSLIGGKSKMQWKSSIKEYSFYLSMVWCERQKKKEEREIRTMVLKKCMTAFSSGRRRGDALDLWGDADKPPRKDPCIEETTFWSLNIPSQQYLQTEVFGPKTVGKWEQRIGKILPKLMKKCAYCIMNTVLFWHTFTFINFFNVVGKIAYSNTSFTPLPLYFITVLVCIYQWFKLPLLDLPLRNRGLEWEV